MQNLPAQLQAVDVIDTTARCASYHRCIDDITRCIVFDWLLLLPVLCRSGMLQLQHMCLLYVILLTCSWISVSRWFSLLSGCIDELINTVCVRYWTVWWTDTLALVRCPTTGSVKLADRTTSCMLTDITVGFWRFKDYMQRYITKFMKSIF